MAAYRRDYDSRHPGADCKEPGSAPDTLGNRVCAAFTFLTLSEALSLNSAGAWHPNPRKSNTGWLTDRGFELVLQVGNLALFLTQQLGVSLVSHSRQRTSTAQQTPSPVAATVLLAAVRIAAA